MTFKNNFIQRTKALLIVGAAFVCCSALIIRYIYLYNQPYLWGPDVYYYALQLKYYVQTGMFKIADRSLLLPLMGVTAKLGFTYEQSIIGWTVLIQLLTGVSVIVAHRLQSGKYLLFPSIWLVLYVIFSPTYSYLCLAFPKYAFALFFLPFWSLGFVNRRYWALSLAAVILSGLSHLSMIGIAMLVLLVVSLRGKIQLRRFKLITLIIFGLSLSVFILIFIIRKYFLLADLNRISWDGLKPPLLTLMLRDGIQPILKLEIIIALMITIGIVLFRKPLDYNVHAGALWAPFILFLTMFPLGSKEYMGISERLSLLLPAVTVCILLGINYLSPIIKRTACIFLCGGLIFASFYPHIYYHFVYPNNNNFEYKLYHQVVREIQNKDIPMLIAHQGLNYYYKYQTMKESFPYEPEEHWPKDKTWRLVFGIRNSEWGYFLTENRLWNSGFLFDLSGDYSLVREDVWNEFRNRVGQESQNPDLRYRVFDSWYNPSQKRPEFSRKRAVEKDDGGEFSAYP
jgi:hypothetical protein